MLGIIYLTFQVFPIIFEEKHGFNLQSTGLTFLGMATGMLLGLGTMPYWNRCVQVPPCLFSELRPPPSTPHFPEKAKTDAGLLGWGLLLALQKKKEVPQVQRSARRPRPAGGVPSPDGASRWRARSALALLARPVDLPRPLRALDRVGAGVGAVRDGHLLHLHVLLHVHRRRVPAGGGDGARVQRDDAHVVRGRVPAVRGADVPRARHGRRDATFGGSDHGHGATSVCTPIDRIVHIASSPFLLLRSILSLPSLHHHLHHHRHHHKPPLPTPSISTQ